MISITKVTMPASKIALKCPNPMTPSRIVVHNTYNDASAMSEISYMMSNNNTVSFHFAVDDTRVVQGVELNRNAWHAGDGNGKGNRQGIAIEICYSRSGGDRFTAAEKNGAELTAYLLKQYGWGMDRVTKHQDYSGKYCPHRTLDLGWQRFLNLVKAYLNGGEPTPTPTPTPTPVPSAGAKRNSMGQCGPNPDLSKYSGVYDAGVATLQQILKLTVDGKASPTTYNALKSYTVQKNDRGNLIKWAQNRLNALGYQSGVADGFAEQPTMDAIVRFQKDYGLGTGYMGGTDWYYMIES